MNKDKIFKLIHKYEELERPQKQKLYEKIESQWQLLYDDYCKLCNSDALFLSLEEKVKEFDYILNYSVLSDYGGYEKGDFIWLEELEHERNEYQKDKEVAENFDNLLNDLQKQLNEAIAKNDTQSLEKIQEIKNQMLTYKKMADRYHGCITKIELKKHYEQNYKKLVKPIKARYLKLSTKYAKKVLDKHLEQNPTLLCSIPKTNLEPTDKSLATVDAKVLYDMCNKMRNDAIYVSEFNGIQR